MRSERDSQRAKLYRAERMSGLETWNRPGQLSRDECEQMLARVTRSATWRKLGGSYRGVALRKGGRGAVSWGGEISLGTWARTPLILLHELAHELTAYAPASHGPEFAAVYLRLVSRFLGRDAAKQLRLNFRAQRVRTRRKRKRRLTPEQREVLRDRMLALRATR